MKSMTRKIAGMSVRGASAVALSLIVVLGASTVARADGADARRLLKAMSDYLAAQQAISFAYDSILGVVSKEGQNLALASSGSVVLNRPDKIIANRHGGFADIEMSFDGKTLTLLGKSENRYAQVDIPGDIGNLVDVLRDKYSRPLPAADLLTANAYDVLMDGVVDVKDLGSGVIDGAECNYLAFRKKDVDFEIWIAMGADPYPCRYVITATGISGSPEYSIQLRDWKTGDAVAATDFSFNNASKAEKIDPQELEGANVLPGNFSKGEEK